MAAWLTTNRDIKEYFWISEKVALFLILRAFRIKRESVSLSLSLIANQQQNEKLNFQYTKNELRGGLHSVATNNEF